MSPSRPPTASSADLVRRYDGIVCDLDGVVYRSHRPVPYAVASLERARQEGVRVAYATNNASRPPHEVAEQLRSLGLTVSSSAVVTSSQAGARHLAEVLARGAPVLAVGGPGVSAALDEAGLAPVTADLARQGARVEAVLQGYGADVSWHDLAEAAYAIAAGARWVATNIDSTLPTDRGTAPGNGALVGAVRCAVDQHPVVVGKPNTPLYELSAAVLDSALDRTLAIGDRLDTDIAGAVAAGIDSLFVLGGVHGLRDVALARSAERPRYLGMDLRCLHEPYEQPVPVNDGEGLPAWCCGRVVARLTVEGALELTGDGSPSQRLRAAVAAVWQARDAVAGGRADVVVGRIAWDDLEVQRSR